MKTLQTIQTISRIGKIISTIIFVCCIVGFCLCIVGVIGLAVGVPVLKFGGVTLESLLQTPENMTTGSMFSSVIWGAILCAGEGVLAKFASRYFSRELADGTPFTADGAKDLLRLGILSICIPIAMQIASQIVQALLIKAFTDVEPPQSDPAVSVTVGVVMLIMALLCKYGAEQAAEQEKAD